MYAPQFKLTKGDRIYIGEKYVSDGKWLVTQEYIKSPAALKALHPIRTLMLGTYDSGIAGGQKEWRSDGLPNFEQIIPRREGYLPLTPRPIGAEFGPERLAIYAFHYECPGFTIGVAEMYAPLIDIGAAFAKDKISPIIILDSGDLDKGNLLAIVMPYRLEMNRRPKNASTIDAAAANLVAEWNAAGEAGGVNWDTFTPLMDALKNAVKN